MGEEPEKIVKGSVKTPAIDGDVTQAPVVKVQTDILLHEKVITNKPDTDSIIGCRFMVTLLMCCFGARLVPLFVRVHGFLFSPRFRPGNEAIVAGKNGGVAGDVDVNSDDYSCVGRIVWRETHRLLYLESENPSKPIHMYLNSPGGAVTAGALVFASPQRQIIFAERSEMKLRFNPKLEMRLDIHYSISRFDC
ncbi:hypothetical protein HAX54_031723 [Datura stramonium]|uniref:ATP-dependent Clp protease proteolytic subunit n=1 Tax=Datura stramonium TaxID=4076 RepID=A0ABS8SC76_DATST|nr:hypothetical protein [Datura stramonium]